MRNWFEFFTHIKKIGFNPTTIVDVGVATDTEDLYWHFPNAKYLFVEPLQEFESNLQQLCGLYPGSNYMLAAAGATNGELEILVTPDLGSTSRFETIESRDGAYDMAPRTVPQLKIDTMWDTLELSGPALLKIDVQGGEIEVLKGADKTLNNFEVIVLEVGLIEQYIGQPIFSDYISYMTKKDFVAYDIIHTGYADTGMLCQVDLVFVKKDGQFRQDQRALIDYDKAKGLDNYKGVKRNNEL